MARDKPHSCNTGTSKHWRQNDRLDQSRKTAGAFKHTNPPTAHPHPDPNNYSKAHHAAFTSESQASPDVSKKHTRITQPNPGLSCQSSNTITVHHMQTAACSVGVFYLYMPGCGWGG